MTKNNDQLKITLVRGLIGLTQRQKSCVYGLGLKKRHSSIVLNPTPENLGMVEKVRFLLQIEKV
ncbi:MAG: 50S ribosomal protein L30 [Pseudomonadota bacterium]|nr:50S ribosomal protein L30 [Pseudomonadota bacterium]